MIGMNRPNSMTRPVATSQYGANGAGADGFFAASLNPYVSPRPSKPEPLFALAELNSYMSSLNPWAPGLFSDAGPQSIAANRPVGSSTNSGWASRARAASFISFDSTFL